jgi:hypothetical protein
MKGTQSMENQGLIVLLIVIILLLLIVLFLLWRRLRNEPSGEARSLKHFVAGQVNVFAEHAPGLSKPAIAAAVGASKLFSDRRLIDAFIAPERVVTFERDGRALSLVFVDVPQAQEEQSLLGLVGDLNRQFPLTVVVPQKGRYDQTGRQQSPGAGRLAAAGEAQAGAPAQPGQLTLRQASPNWLAAGAGQHNGSGGPGGRPYPPDLTSLDGANADGVQPWEFVPVPGLELPPSPEQRGDGVHIYILDTAPDSQALNTAYQNWRQPVEPSPPLPPNASYVPNPVIERLVDPQNPNRLDVIYANPASILQQADFFIEDHNYVMSDHGLFVAGIIHAIAPAATLHLVEVLNPYGVGTLESIARGFALAASQVDARPKLLVNASLFFDLPQPDDQWLATLIEEDPFWRNFTPEQINATVDPIRQIFALLAPAEASPFVGVVAAAGNDGTNSLTQPPPARFPAAFPGVLGVGALKKNLTVAEYSNIADTPASDGIAAYGGDKTGDYADPVTGILGIYTGDFPSGAANRLGLARWSGTSFATPVITGTIAALMGDGQTFQAALTTLKAVAANPEATVVGEVFPMVQP